MRRTDTRTRDTVVRTYLCQGCQRRFAAPAPYGGFWLTACSPICEHVALGLAKQQRADRWLQALVSTEKDDA